MSVRTVLRRNAAAITILAALITITILLLATGLATWHVRY